MTYFRTHWRIVRDNYMGYEVQYRRWWSPFWKQHNGCNTLATLNAAHNYVRRYANPVVWTMKEEIK